MERTHGPISIDTVSHVARYLHKMRFSSLLFFSAFLFSLFCSCVWNDTDYDSSYLPLDDSEYPYAGLFRLVIETDDFEQINDRETKHSARLQIYGEKAPTSDIKKLTVKGRGNSSFIMAKYGMKLEFENKEELFGMPRNRDWDLVANHRDKSLLRNYITYQLADLLDDEYAPRSTFVEVFLNREYMGLYQLVEHMKVAKKRINIPENDESFLFEKTTATTTGVEANNDSENGENDVKYISTDKSIIISSLGYIFQINSPKEPSSYSVDLLKNHIDSLETFLQGKGVYSMDSIARWIDIDDFVRYYMIQEFTKNLDGAFRRSIYMTWLSGDVLRMGPVWDFDLGYGLSSSEKVSPEGWYTRKYGWYRFLFKSDKFKEAVSNYWDAHKDKFAALEDSLESASFRLKRATKNEFKRWPILEACDYWPFIESYDNYEEAIDSLKAWIEARWDWVDENL